MKKQLILLACAAAVTGAAQAQQYPVLDAVANRVVEKYQTASCEELWQKRTQPKSPEEQRAVQFLREDPQMRQAFFNQIAGPVVNKMFECGMIP